MKKKLDRKFSIVSTDWSKSSVSIVEANQTQQTVILLFNDNQVLSKYALCKCKVSPLLGTPETVSSFFFDLPDIPVNQNQKVYIVFNDEDLDSSNDDEGNLILFLKSENKFELDEDEVIGLLYKDSEEHYKLLDWDKVIIDEPIPLSAIDQFSTQKSITQNLDFYKKDKKNTSDLTPKSNNIKKSFYEKLIFWLLIFWVSISIFEIFSLINYNDTLNTIIINSSLLTLKNLFLGFFLYLILRKKKFKFISFTMLFFINIVLLYYAYYIFFINLLIGSLILALFTIIITLSARSYKAE